jgi:hypothetical protein
MKRNKFMKRIAGFLPVWILACMMTSCLTYGLEDIETFEETEITDVRFEFRYKDPASLGLDGEPIVKWINLTILERELNSEAGTIACTLQMPSASGSFTSDIRSQVSLSNLVGKFYLSTAARIEPVEGAPVLGVPGDFSAPRKYKVTAADGKTSKVWTITVDFLADPVVIKSGSWLFDDANNLLKASVGQDLVPNGEGFTAIPGPGTSNGAVRIASKSYFKALHGMAANGGGNRVNRYTIQVDFRVAAIGRYYSFFQTTLENNDDAEFFLRPAGNLGIGGTGYSSLVVTPGEWHRLVISAGMGSSYEYYLDGTLIHQGNTDAASVDSRYSWLPEGVLLFADEDGEDNEIDIAEVTVWSGAMNADQVAALGKVQ